MSLRKYKNPVNNYFIYNDDIRKSTCKICYFDMAGRHSENLMRHLKRKHPLTYTQVMIEKQRRRAAVSADSAAQQSQKQSGSSDNTSKATDTAAAAEAAAAAAAATGPSSLSSMFKFETEPHKLFIKSVIVVPILHELNYSRTTLLFDYRKNWYFDSTIRGNSNSNSTNNNNSR